MTETLIQIKENDVFHFHYTKEYREAMKGWDLHHCCEMMAVAKLTNGKMILYDTYWGVGDKSGKSFELESIGKEIEVTYYCNLNEIEENTHAERYFDEKDIFTLHRQHACHNSCITNYIRKGAVRSKSKMTAIVNEKIDDAKRKINSAIRDIEWNTDLLRRIETEDINSLYI